MDCRGRAPGKCVRVMVRDVQALRARHKAQFRALFDWVFWVILTAMVVGGVVIVLVVLFKVLT